jgi:hypothetical protein
MTSFHRTGKTHFSQNLTSIRPHSDRLPQELLPDAQVVAVQAAVLEQDLLVGGGQLAVYAEQEVGVGAGAHAAGARLDAEEVVEQGGHDFFRIQTNSQHFIQQIWQPQVAVNYYNYPVHFSSLFIICS